MHPKTLLLPALLAPGAAFALPEGFEIREFAKPPEVEYPTAISVSPAGDVYVSSDKNASLGHEKNFGKIVRATDTDGDGKADKFVDFVKNVDSPRGSHFVGGTLFLIHPPYLSSFRDTNGDGVADEKKQLVKGFGWGIEHPRGADHTTNGVRMGIDGWLYVGVGDFGMPDAEGTDGRKLALHGGGVVRVRPDGSEIEPYALMTRNHYAPAITPYLDMFVRDNTNDGKGWNTRLHHFTALGDHGYPRLYQNFNDEAIQPLADYGGGSGTGGLFLHEPGFREDYSNTLFTCDWTTGHIYSHPLEPFEASFIAKQEVFHELPRAIDIDVDGHSRLYLADWRNGGYTFEEGKDVGMIQQVVYPAGEPAEYEDVTKAADAPLPELLASPSAVQRLEAQREILARGQKVLFAEKINALALDPKQPLYARVAAIFTFKQLYGKSGTPYLAKLTADPLVREFALRAMTDRRGELEGVPLEPYLAGLKDEDPRVRLQALVGLARLEAKQAAPAILAAAAEWPRDDSEAPQGAHHRLPHTAVKALVEIGNVDACLRALGDPRQSWYALRALQEIHGEAVVEGLVRAADSATDPDLLEGTVGALARLYHVEKEWDRKSWWETRPDDRGPYFEPIEWKGTPQVKQAIERAFSKIPQARHEAVMEVLGKNRVNLSSLELGDLDPVVAAMGADAPLGGGQLRTLLDAARDPNRSWTQRLEIYRALSKAEEKMVMPSRLAVLSQWSEGRRGTPEAVTQAITDFVNETARGEEVAQLRELATKQSDATSRIAWKAMLTVLNSPLAKDEAKQAVRQAIDDNPREVGFFRAIADLKLGGFEPQIEVGLNSDNQRLIRAAEAARDAAAEAASASTGRKVAEVSVEEARAFAMENKGDPATGERLYVSQGCIACHAVDPAAEQKGPYLGTAGSAFTRDYLIDSVLEPDKVVAQGFRTAMFQLNDGGSAMGFVTGEADGVIELRDIAGNVTKIRRENVKERTDLPNSMMPPGLAANLTLEEFASMIEYLVSLRAEQN